MEADAKDDRLDEIRSIIYKACLASPSYPYPKEVELKRRKKTKKGERVSYKLANDIYLILSAWENGSFEGIKDILSLPKSYNKTDLNSTQCDSEQITSCLNKISLLKEALSKSQSDIISLKQDRESFKKSITEDVKSLKSELAKLRNDVFDQIDTIRTDVERIEGEKSSGIVSLKNAMKLVSDDCKLISDNAASDSKCIRDRVTSLSKKVDKQFQILDSKISDLSKTCNKDSPHNTEMCVNDSSNKKSSDPRKNTVCQSVSYKEVLTGEKPYQENPVQVKDHSCSVNSSINRDPIEQTKHGCAEQLASSARDSPSNSCNAPTRSNVAGDPCETTYSSGRSSHNTAQGIPTIITNRKGVQPKYAESEKEQDTQSRSRERYRYPTSDIACDDKGNDDYDDDDFTECVIKKTKRFYLGGFRSSIKTQKLVNYVTNRGLKVTMIRVFGLGSGRSVTIRLNVETKNSGKLLESGFWPRGVICRPWISKKQYMKKFHSNNGALDIDQEDEDFSADIAYNGRKRKNRFNAPTLRSERNDYDQHQSYSNYYGGDADYRVDSYDRHDNYKSYEDSNHYYRHGRYDY